MAVYDLSSFNNLIAVVSDCWSWMRAWLFTTYLFCEANDQTSYSQINICSRRSWRNWWECTYFVLTAFHCKNFMKFSRLDLSVTLFFPCFLYPIWMSCLSLPPCEEDRKTRQGAFFWNISEHPVTILLIDVWYFGCLHTTPMAQLKTQADCFLIYALLYATRRCLIWSVGRNPVPLQRNRFLNGLADSMTQKIH